MTKYENVGRWDIKDLFLQKKYLKISAPMVRYSKLPFRKLVRKYDCDLCFTPMIIADSFVNSNKARLNEFKTSSDDRPLITQFASHNVDDFVAAAELVYPFCDGVDLNCGCPQRWAIQEGYGACLLRTPDKIHDIVKQIRNRLPINFSMSVKLRTEHNITRTIELCRQLEHCGVTFISVHTRTPDESSKKKANHEAISLLTSVCRDVPIVANGDVNSLEVCERLYTDTKCKGMMSARALLRNPALFQGYDKTPMHCVHDWIDVALSTGSSYSCFHHHVEFMLENQLLQPQRRLLRSLECVPSLLNFINKL